LCLFFGIAVLLLVKRHSSGRTTFQGEDQFDGLVAEWRGGFADDPGSVLVLRREIALAHWPATAAGLAGRRVAGLFRPWDGVPPEGRRYVQT